MEKSELESRLEALQETYKNLLQKAQELSYTSPGESAKKRIDAQAVLDEIEELKKRAD